MSLSVVCYDITQTYNQVRWSLNDMADGTVKYSELMDGTGAYIIVLGYRYGVYCSEEMRSGQYWYGVKFFRTCQKSCLMYRYGKYRKELVPETMNISWDLGVFPTAYKAAEAIWSDAYEQEARDEEV